MSETKSKRRTALIAAAVAALCIFPVMAHTTYEEPSEAPPTAARLLAEAGGRWMGEGGYLEQLARGSHFVEIEADGTTHTLATCGATVEQLLARADVQLGQLDRVSEPLEARSYDGMVVAVTRVDDYTVTYEAELPAQERVYLNTVLAPGQETVLQEGQDGRVLRTVNIVRENGKLASRDVLEEDTLVAAEDRIVIRGAEDAAMPAAAEGNAILTAGGEILEYTRVIDGKATAYNCPGYVGRTASGTIAEVGKVAVDPKVIPLGTSLYVVSQDGEYVYGYCIAEDTGGLIKGNKVDLYFSTWDECIQFGYRPVTIYVLD